MALISLDHVGKLYPKGSRPALDDINLSISRGEFIFLVGSSGSGKTTLLSLLLREEEATQGEIHVAGNDLRRMSHRQVPHYRRQIGFIFQDYKLLNNKTVWQNVAFALEVVGASRSTIRRLVTNALNTVGLSGKESNYPHELSGGEAQRVAIARAYVNHPQIILADEPTGNLDPTTSLGIMEVLDAINRTGTTIVMATHNEEIVNSMRKRVIELHNGCIVRDEQRGSYDSALFFPDEEVEAKAQEVLQSGTLEREEVGKEVVIPSSDELASDDTQSEYAEHRQELDRDANTSSWPEVDNASSRDESSRDGLTVETPLSSFKEDLEAHKESLSKEESEPSKSNELSNAERNTVASQPLEIREQTFEEEGLARLSRSLHSGRTGRYGEVFKPLEETMTWGQGLPIVETPTASSEQSDNCVPSNQDSSQERQQTEHTSEDSPNKPVSENLENQLPIETSSASPVSSIQAPPPPGMSPLLDSLHGDKDASASKSTLSQHEMNGREENQA